MPPAGSFSGTGVPSSGDCDAGGAGVLQSFREELESLIQEQMKKGNNSSHVWALRQIADFMATTSPAVLPTSPMGTAACWAGGQGGFLFFFFLNEIYLVFLKVFIWFVGFQRRKRSLMVVFSCRKAGKWC